jgi:predicted transcriptional regulator
MIEYLHKIKPCIIYYQNERCYIGHFDHCFFELNQENSNHHFIIIKKKWRNIVINEKSVHFLSVIHMESVILMYQILVEIIFLILLEVVLYFKAQ